MERNRIKYSIIIIILILSGILFIKIDSNQVDLINNKHSTLLLVLFICLTYQYHKKQREIAILSRKASLDIMTGSLNRETGLICLEEHMELCRRHKKSLVIGFIDINNLKEVNDVLGHKEGDNLIIAIVDIIKANLRKEDQICRLGGDEFLIILSNCDIAEGQNIWSRIEQSLGEENHKRQYRYKMSASIGLAEFNHDKMILIEDLLEIADKKMYINKREHKRRLNGGEKTIT
ncbi:GGDEF domain-containing protein [Alkaliphilus hydrothermalis]|uniref:Diguanylate cyclase (GGDEF)-like protein n=1 Tax=Alkaliphilus hydrothermalis TaxID=1482730 RepID=A0ABS2NT75_9FIRM|nr:GGDEF domain-containing protein [Alkaliphilus hydrothermalis]MBM7616138.1 diguanylate cyclase (GGDEF)-like protein [Alkaliphilus hydrothermalis]